jgi:glucosamine kinase
MSGTDRMPDGLLLALEGGGTRSQAALLDSAGRVLHVTDNAAGVNLNFTTIQESQRAVLAAVQGVLTGAQISGERIADFASALVAARFGAELLGEILPHARYHYYGECDVVFARAGRYWPHGVAVVAGTGATAWAVRADDGRQRIFGGWGALLGDEGSGYALGLAGLRAAVRACEGRAEAPTELYPAIRQHFGLAEATFRDELVRLAYHKPLTRAEIAALAPVVTRLAAAGDPLAAQLVAQIAADLAALTLHAARSSFESNERFDVVVAGGLTKAGDLLLRPVRQRLAQEFSGATFAVGIEAPAVALGRLAQTRRAPVWDTDFTDEHG